MGDNSGPGFKKLVINMLLSEDFAQDLLQTTDKAKRKRKLKEELQAYLPTDADQEKADKKLEKILKGTTLDTIRLLASVLDPDHASSVPVDDDAPI